MLHIIKCVVLYVIRLWNLPVCFSSDPKLINSKKNEKEFYWKSNYVEEGNPGCLHS